MVAASSTSDRVRSFRHSFLKAARRMDVSPKTAKNHLASIYRKLDVGEGTQAVLTALRMGLVTL